MIAGAYCTRFQVGICDGTPYRIGCNIVLEAESVPIDVNVLARHFTLSVRRVSPSEYLLQTLFVSSTRAAQMDTLDEDGSERAHTVNA